MSVWQMLNEEQVQEYQQWARDNYEPLSPINGLWHPVVQKECVIMNMEQNTREPAQPPR